MCDGDSTGGVWHVRDLGDGSPAELVEQVWADDERNRRRSLTAFPDELALVDRGLAIYMDALQAAFAERSGWKAHHRASIAMLVHALNSFLALRQLMTLGYLQEAWVLRRSIHEALTRAMAFLFDEALVDKFFQGNQLSVKEVREAVASASSDPGAWRALANLYKRLSLYAHPTLDSFALRMISSPSSGESDLGRRKAVPEGVVWGGLMSDGVGHAAWLELARDIAAALYVMSHVLRDGTGAWDVDYREYCEVVESSMAEGRR